MTTPVQGIHVHVTGPAVGYTSRQFRDTVIAALAEHATHLKDHGTGFRPGQKVKVRDGGWYRGRKGTVERVIPDGLTPSMHRVMVRIGRDLFTFHPTDLEHRRSA